MKKNQVVLLSLILCVMLLVPTLASAAVEPASADAIAKYKPQEGKKYELHVAGWLAGPVDNENGPVLAYFEEQTGLRIVSENIDGTKYADLLNVRLASGDVPDLFSISPHATFSKFYEQGIIKSFGEDELAALSPGFYNQYMLEAPQALDLVRLDPADKNQLMALPQYKFHSQFVFPFVWRLDWLKQVGIEKVPDNLQEMEDAIYKFTKEDPDQNGINDTYGISASGLTAVYGAFGYRPDAWTARDGKLVYGAVQPEMKDALAVLARWYKDGIIDPEFITGENMGGRGDLTQAFHTNRIGLSLHGDYWTWCQYKPFGLNFQEFEKSHENAMDILAITQPILAEDGVSRNTNRAPVVQNTFWCFDSEIPDDLFGKAMAFLDWEYGTYENYRTTWYGLEGEHWAFDEKGYEQPIGDYLKDKGLQNKIGAYTTMGAIIEPFDYQARVRAGLAPWAKDMGLDDPTFEKFGTVNKLLVTTPSYNQYWTELDKIQKETYIDIITGKQSVDSFDQFVDRWMQSGGETVSAEASEWYATQK